MATRLYLPASGTAPLGSLAVDSGWEQTTGLVRRPCYNTKQNTALANDARTWASNTTQDWCWAQYQSPQMSYGYSWTTADTISMVIRCLEGNAACNDYLAYVVKVVSADGVTVRGTIGAYFGTSTEFGTSASTRIHSARTNGATAFTSYPGDRIIIEIGIHGVTPSTSYTQTLRVGDPSGTNDFALTSGLTTDLCPWVELSRSVVFGNALISAQADFCKGGSDNLKTDDFNSYSAGTIGGKGNWVDALNAMYAMGDGTVGIYNIGENASYFNDPNFSADQRAKAKITHPETSYAEDIGVVVRLTNQDYYVLYGNAYNGGQIKLGIVLSGTYNAIASCSSGLAANDTLELRVSGTTLTCYKNGSVITAMGAASSPASGNNGIYTDSRLSSGYPGMSGYGVMGGGSTADDFEAANLASFVEFQATLTQNYHAYFSSQATCHLSLTAVLTQKSSVSHVSANASVSFVASCILHGKIQLYASWYLHISLLCAIYGKGSISAIAPLKLDFSEIIRGVGYINCDSHISISPDSQIIGKGDLHSSIALIKMSAFGFLDFILMSYASLKIWDGSFWRDKSYLMNMKQYANNGWQEINGNLYAWIDNSWRLIDR